MTDHWRSSSVHKGLSLRTQSAQSDPNAESSFASSSVHKATRVWRPGRPRVPHSCTPLLLRYRQCFLSTDIRPVIYGVCAPTHISWVCTSSANFQTSTDWQLPSCRWLHPSSLSPWEAYARGATFSLPSWHENPGGYPSLELPWRCASFPPSLLLPPR